MTVNELPHHKCPWCLGPLNMKAVNFGDGGEMLYCDKDDCWWTPEYIESLPKYADGSPIQQERNHTNARKP